MKALVVVTLLLLAVAIGAFLWDHAVFDAYSRDFGTLTPVQFFFMNARMGQLEAVGRAATFALIPFDVALLIASFRRRSFVVLGFGLLLAALLGLVALAAGAASGGTMIG